MINAFMSIRNFIQIVGLPALLDEGEKASDCCGKSGSVDGDRLTPKKNCNQSTVSAVQR